MFIYALLLATLFVAILQMLVYRFVNLRSIDYTAGFAAERAAEGDRIELVEKIRNHAFIPLPWVRIESAFDLNLRFKGGQSDRRIRLGSQYHQFHYSVFTLPARRQITRRHDVYCAKRGVYKLTSAVMTTGDLLGLQRDTRSIQLYSELIVYPRLIPIDELPVPVHRWLGELLVRHSAIDDPFLVSGVREYVPGDPLRLINWKATAHTTRVMVHRRDFTADSNLVVYLNVEDSKGMWNKVSHPELIERGIMYAASVIQHAVSAGVRVGFATNGSGLEQLRTPVQSGTAHLQHLFETLARLQIERECGFALLLREDVNRNVRNRDILVLTSYVDEQIEEALHALQKLGNIVQVLNVNEVAEVRGEPAWQA